MQAGELDQPVVIRRYTLSADEQGGFTSAATTVDANAWARVRNKSGSERVAGERLEARSAFEVVIRNRSDLLPSDVIVWNGLELQIRSGLPSNPRDTWLTLMCEQGAAI